MTQSTTIIKETVQTCSTTEVSSINANIVVLKAVIVKVKVLIVQYNNVSWTMKVNHLFDGPFTKTLF